MKILESFEGQAQYCDANDAPTTASIVRAIGTSLTRETEFGRRVLDWPGQPIPDALPLRCAGGFHALHLSGAEPSLAPLYQGEAVDVAALIAAAMARHDAALLPWLDGPPQTNEAGRSSNYIAALLWLTARGLANRYELLEIGSSAGLNLMIDRYHYDLGGVTTGPEDSAMRFTPEWRGPPPPAAAFAFASLRGCDIAPVDLADPAQALRLTAYIWPEHHIRFARMTAAIEMVKAAPPNLVQSDADAWVETALAEPQASGTARVLMHSIVWQYIGQAGQARITAAMEAAGAQATADKPLIWIAVEANRDNFKHELTVHYWPGDGATHLLANAHAHGQWIEWLA
jgi:hypothetical protein